MIHVHTPEIQKELENSLLLHLFQHSRELLNFQVCLYVVVVRIFCTESEKTPPGKVKDHRWDLGHLGFGLSSVLLDVDFSLIIKYL